MTKLVALSGDKTLKGPLDIINPLELDNIALGMLYWSRVLKDLPNLTFGEIRNIRMEKKGQPGKMRGSAVGDWLRDNVTDPVQNFAGDVIDTVGDVANWVADTSGDAARLIFLEESEGGQTIVGQGMDVAGTFLTGGGSLALKDIAGEGDLLDNILGFFRGTGEKVRSDIDAAGFKLSPEAMWIGGGALGLLAIGLLVMAVRK